MSKTAFLIVYGILGLVCSIGLGLVTRFNPAGAAAINASIGIAEIAVAGVLAVAVKIK